MVKEHMCCLDSGGLEGLGWGLGQGLVPNGWMNVSAWHLSRCAHDNFLSI